MALPSPLGLLPALQVALLQGHEMIEGAEAVRVISRTLTTRPFLKATGTARRRRAMTIGMAAVTPRTDSETRVA
jgi:hypothetical protein